MLPIYPQGRPFFSVIIATYNRMHLLVRAMDSVVDQQEMDWELLVVDDGSSDRTDLRVLAYINDTQHRIRYLFHTHRGVAHSRNAGIMAAVGHYVTFLDSDDWYKPDHLRLIRTYLRAHPEALVLQTGLTVQGNPYVPDVYRPGKLIHVKECAAAGTLVFRKEVLIRLGGFPDVTFAEDARLMEKVRRAGIPVHTLPQETYVYDRSRNEGITAAAAYLFLPKRAPANR